MANTRGTSYIISLQVLERVRAAIGIENKVDPN